MSIQQMLLGAGAVAGPFDPRKHFDVKLYTGNNATNTQTGLGFSPDLVWIKNRTDSSAHRVFDTIRGATEALYSSHTDAEYTESTALTAFTSDGFTVSTENAVNGSSDAIVAWCWNAGNAASTTSISVGAYNLNDVTWSDSASGGTNASTNAFDSTNARWNVDSTSTSSALTMTFSPGLNGTLSFSHFGANQCTFQWEVNGSLVGSPHAGSDSYATDTIGSFTNVTSLKYRVITASSGTVGGFARLYLNGVELVDDGVTPSVNVPSIATEYKANPAAGFSIVTYTGVNNATPTSFGHGLNSEPKFVIIKNRTDAEDWAVYHASVGNTKYLQLNENTAATDDSGYWNDTSPTTTVVTVNNSADVQRISRDYLALCWSEVEGYSKFGEFTGTGASGNSITCGFEPTFLMIKRQGNGSDGDTTYGSWIMLDNKRTGANDQLFANCPQAEGGRGDCSSTADQRSYVSFTSTGFELGSGYYELNDTVDYIYAAFA